MNKSALLKSYVNSCNVAELHSMCKEYGWGGHSALSRDQLISHVLRNAEEARSTAKEKKQMKKAVDKITDKTAKIHVEPEKHTTTPHAKKKKVVKDEDEEYEEYEDYYDDDFVVIEKEVHHNSSNNNGKKKRKEVMVEVIEKVHHNSNNDNSAKKQKERIPEEVRRECFRIVFDDELQGKCPVCKFTKISCTKGQFQAAHIIAEANGGLAVADNLVPSCGCNQLMGKTNLFDYMGTSTNLRTNVCELAFAYWRVCVPPAQREKDLKKHGRKNVLVEFVKIRYKPVHIDNYKDWLEIPESHVI